MGLCVKTLVATGLIHSQVVLPPIDSDGRIPTNNKHGYADPLRTSETQEEFVTHAIENTSRPLSSTQKNPIALEIGVGFAPLGPRIIKAGGRYFAIDLDEAHIEYTDEQLEAAQTKENQFETAVGRIPFTPDQWELNAKLNDILDSNEITDIGLFQVAMYMSGEEIIEFLKWAFKILPSGGRVYMTGASAYGNAFPQYEDRYHRKLRNFFKMSEIEPFPGWIPRLTSPSMAPHTPAGFLDQYPEYFHIFDHRVFEVYAKQIGFKTEGKFLRKLIPSRFIYTGPTPHVGELSSLVLEKP